MSSPIWRFIKSGSDSILTIGYLICDKTYIHMHTSTIIGIVIEVVHEDWRVVFQSVSKTRWEEIYNKFCFLGAIAIRETEQFIDLLFNTCTIDGKIVDAYHSMFVDRLKEKILKLFLSILNQTRFLVSFDDYSESLALKDQVVKDLYQARFDDCRGILADILVGINRETVVELSYNIGKGNENNWGIGGNIKVIIGIEYTQIILSYNDQYHAFYPYSSYEIKYGLFYDMFVTLGVCNVDKFVEEVQMLFYTFAKKTSFAALTEAVSKIKYDSELVVCDKRILYDDDSEEYYWLPYDTGCEVFRASTSFQEGSRNLKNMRNICIDKAASVIQAAYKGWKARCQYAFNPYTSLGKYYVLKDFNTTCTYIVSNEREAMLGCGSVIKFIFGGGLKV